MKNKNQELDIVLKDYLSGTISTRKALNQIASFIIKNYRVFGLQNFDEDFRQDLILSILEHGEYLLQNYDPDIGDFFTFLYCYIKTLRGTRQRHLAQNSLCERMITEELEKDIDEKMLQYSRIKVSQFETPKAPYAYKPVPAEELKKTLHAIAAENTNKKILVLALKSSYYLSDHHIKKISNICNIDENLFYETVQICKDSIQKRAVRREKFIDRRDSAYYHHRRCKKLVDQLNSTEGCRKELIAKINTKAKRFNKRWLNLNNLFDDGLLTLRPTSKTIADLLGICERQVNYYIHCAKKEFQHKEKKGLLNKLQ